MKRILAALKGKIESQKMERKVTRAIRAIDTAKDNAQDIIDKTEDEMMMLLSQIAESSEVNMIISQISDKIGDIEEQKEVIARLDKVKQFIEEDVEIEEE